MSIAKFNKAKVRLVYELVVDPIDFGYEEEEISQMDENDWVITAEQAMEFPLAELVDWEVRKY